MKKIITHLTPLLIFALLMVSKTQAQVPAPEIVKYYFVDLLTNPDKPELPKAQVDSIQAAHMANIGKMVEEGVLMLAGPFEGGGGIFILKVETVEAAEKLVNRDPAVQAGRLKVKIRPWYTTLGVFTAEKSN